MTADRWPDGARDLRYVAPGETVTAAEWLAHARNAEREARELADLARTLSVGAIELIDSTDARPWPSPS